MAVVVEVAAAVVAEEARRRVREAGLVGRRGLGPEGLRREEAAVVAAAVAAAPALPKSLPAALDALDDSAAMRAGLGDAFVDSYVKLRRAHWEEYAAHLSQWEVQAYLDC